MLDLRFFVALLDDYLFGRNLYAYAVAFEPIVVGVGKEDIMLVGGKYRLIITAFIDGRKHGCSDLSVFLVVEDFHVVEVNEDLDGRARFEIGLALEVHTANFHEVFTRDNGVDLVDDASFVHYVEVERLDVNAYSFTDVVRIGVVRHDFVAVGKERYLIVVTLKHR